MSDILSAAELAELEAAGAVVKRKEKAPAAPAPKKEPRPEASMLAVQAADQERRLAEGDANRQLMAMTNELLRSLRDELSTAIREGHRVPAPWTFSVQRDKKGLIETIRAVPEA